MTLLSDLKYCLMWETELPWNISPRQSPYFRLEGEEWYLKISLSKQKSTSQRYNGYICCVFMHPREVKKIAERGISASCLVLAGNEVFGDLIHLSDLNLGLIKRFFIPSQHFMHDSIASERWKIFCHIRCVESLSIQIINDKILLSTGPVSTASDPSVQTVAEIPPDLRRLSEDFSRLLDKEIIPDAKVTCCDRTWRVHRSVLTARSEVFAAMFLSGMAESESGSVRIEDLEAPVLDSLLKYVYSGKVPDVSAENLCGLYEAADRYALHGLREACSNWMAKKLSLENCLGFLVVADAHGDDLLREAAVLFITKHFAQFERAIWTTFRKEHTLLAIEVLERFAPLMKL